MKVKEFIEMLNTVDKELDIIQYTESDGYITDFEIAVVNRWYINTKGEGAERECVELY